MYKLFVSDFYRLIKDPKLYLAPFVYFLLYDILLSVIANIPSKNMVNVIYGGELILEMSTYIPFVLAIFAGMFIHTDFRDGTIRNKLMSGVKRSELFLSSVTVFCCYAFYLCMMQHVLGLIIGQ